MHCTCFIFSFFFVNCVLLLLTCMSMFFSFVLMLCRLRSYANKSLITRDLTGNSGNSLTYQRYFWKIIDCHGKHRKHLLLRLLSIRERFLTRVLLLSLLPLGIVKETRIKPTYKSHHRWRHSNGFCYVKYERWSWNAKLIGSVCNNIK